MGPSPGSGTSQEICVPTHDAILTPDGLLRDVCPSGVLPGQWKPRK
jgi:hypothetical protein